MYIKRSRTRKTGPNEYISQNFSLYKKNGCGQGVDPPPPVYGTVRNLYVYLLLP